MSNECKIAFIHSLLLVNTSFERITHTAVCHAFFSLSAAKWLNICLFYVYVAAQIICPATISIIPNKVANNVVTRPFRCAKKSTVAEARYKLLQNLLNVSRTAVLNKIQNTIALKSSNY